MAQQLSESRIAQWDAFYEALSPEEQKDMDRRTRNVIEALQERGGRQFGPAQAHELLIALIEWRVGIRRPKL